MIWVLVEALQYQNPDVAGVGVVLERVLLSWLDTGAGGYGMGRFYKGRASTSTAEGGLFRRWRGYWVKIRPVQFKVGDVVEFSTAKSVAVLDLVFNESGCIAVKEQSIDGTDRTESQSAGLLWQEIAPDMI